MGTGWSLHAVAASVAVRPIAEAAFADVIAQMSQWDEGSELSRFNRAPAGEWFTISAEFAHVVEAALEVQQLSGGAFSPSLGALSEDWGFGASAFSAQKPPVPAPKKDIGIALDLPARRIKRANDHFLDLSGIAKGFAVDLVAERLLAAGVHHFLIEIGGELRGEGIEPSGQPWWVDIAMPPTSRIQPYRVALHDLSIATSGNYRRGVTIDGEYFSHSFDPRTGAPIRHAVSSVTVLHRQAMLADTWATALTVLGAKEAHGLANELDLAMCLVEGDREWTSKAWREMLY
jgi:thiamine biosynthesis lipoprotein